MTNAIKQKTKYSDVEWFGKVPQEWQVKKLKFVFKYFTGGTPDSGKEKYYAEDGLNWITITDLNGKFTSESKNKITPLAVKDKNMKIAPEGSLLYSFKLSVGQMAFVSKDTYTNEAIFAILPDKDINLDFWYYALQSYLIENANENIYGAKIFNQHLIDNSILLVPPPSIQKNIGKYLDIKTEEVKKFIDDKKKLISLLEEQKMTIIYEVVTKGLDKNVKNKPSGITWLECIPSDWQVKRLKYVSNTRVSNVDKKSEDEQVVRLCNYTDVYKNDSITNYLDFMEATATKDQIEKFLLKNDDVIITKDSETPDDMGVPAYVNVSNNKDIVCGYHLAIITPDNSILLGKYLFRLLETKLFRSYFEICSNGVTRYGLDTYSMLNALIPLPPINTQKIIIEYLDIEIPKIDQAIHTVQQEIELIEEYKKSLIYQAVTGKIEALLTSK